MAKKETKRRRGRPGHLGDAARALGLTHSHLWRVVKGQRVHPRTMAAYRMWRRENMGR